MLELYHHGSSVCAAKVRIVLEEKGLEYKKHYIDILKGEQFNPEYLKINPKGVVPTLVDDGKIVTESTVCCEYLDWTHPGDKPLTPSDPLQRADMLRWTKLIDEELHPACGTITFTCSHRYTVLRMGTEKVETFLESTPRLSLVSDWKERKRRYVELGLDDNDARKAIMVHEMVFDKMETVLSDNSFLAGDSFSLADAGMIPYLNRIYMLSMLDKWCEEKPHVLSWFEKMRERPTFNSAIDSHLPESLAADLRTNGAKSWPKVQEILLGVREEMKVGVV